jgi:hypothetical protein
MSQAIGKEACSARRFPKNNGLQIVRAVRWLAGLTDRCACLNEAFNNAGVLKQTSLARIAAVLPNLADREGQDFREMCTRVVIVVERVLWAAGKLLHRRPYLGTNGTENARPCHVTWATIPRHHQRPDTDTA